MVKVSVIIPIYNVEPFLSKCIESVRNQSLEEIEIILVNDGSPDNCGKIIDEYALLDDRIRVIHKENGGQSSARNAGLEIATGEYVQFVDGDDWIESVMLANLFAIAQGKSADIVICNYNKIYFSHIEENFLSIAEEDIFLEQITLPTYLNKYYSYNRHGMSACNKLYKKAVIDKSALSFIDAQIVGCEDGLFYLCYLLHTQIVSITDKAYYNYRQRKGSAMHSPRPQLIKQHTNMIKIFVEYANLNHRENELKDIIPILLLMNIISGIKDNIRTGETNTHIINQLKESSLQMPYFHVMMKHIAFGRAVSKWDLKEQKKAAIIKKFLVRIYALLSLLRLFTFQVTITRIWSNNNNITGELNENQA